MVTLALIVTANFFFWSYMNQPDEVQSWEGLMMGVSFNPARRDDDPVKGMYPSKTQIDQDLALLKGKGSCRKNI